MMYEERYGTDWEALGTEAAIERAYALGGLAELDRGLPEEYDRVRAAAGAGPAADMVELAYEEGRRAVAGVDAGDRTDREAWEELVEDATSEFTRGENGSDSEGEEPPASAPPSSLSALESPEYGPDMLELPEFLRRD